MNLTRTSTALGIALWVVCPVMAQVERRAAAVKPKVRARPATIQLVSITPDERRSRLQLPRALSPPGSRSSNVLNQTEKRALVKAFFESPGARGLRWKNKNTEFPLPDYILTTRQPFLPNPPGLQGDAELAFIYPETVSTDRNQATFVDTGNSMRRGYAHARFSVVAGLYLVVFSVTPGSLLIPGSAMTFILEPSSHSADAIAQTVETGRQFIPILIQSLSGGSTAVTIKSKDVKKPWTFHSFEITRLD